MQYKLHIGQFLETLPQVFSILPEPPPAPIVTPEVEPIEHAPLKKLHAEVEQYIQQVAKEEGLAKDSKEIQMLQELLSAFNNLGMIVEEQSKKEVSKEEITIKVINKLNDDLTKITKNYDTR